MYTPSAFANDDHQVVAAFLKAYPFATLCRNGATGPVIAHAPLVAEISDGRIVGLTGHLARANPFWQDGGDTDIVALFSGPDGYMSPGYYPSKQEHGRIVPTWNYIRAELRGRATFETAAERMLPYVEVPTQMMEAGRAVPWSTQDAPEDYIAKMLHAIVGLHIEVTRVTGSWKLDQRKSEADRRGGMAGLTEDGNVNLAQAMRESLGE